MLRKPTDPPPEIRYVIHKGHAAAAELSLTDTTRRKLFMDTLHAELEKDFCGGCYEAYADCTCEVRGFGDDISAPAADQEPTAAVEQDSADPHDPA